MHRWRYARRMLPVSINRQCFVYWIPLLIYILTLNLTCWALPSPAIKISSMSAIGDVKHKSETGHIVNLTRQHNADVFTAIGMSTCNADTCVGLSSGTAEQIFLNADKTTGIASKPAKRKDRTPSAEGVCECGCLPYLSTYREDLGICVDDIHECTLSPFVSGSSSEKIPFVFLPLLGQIIYPSREISFSEIRTPVCAVTGSQYLTTTGWVDLRNPIDTDFPFRMFRDEGRTFLQWLGEPDLRNKMQGRLILVHLMCRDMSALPVILNNEKSSTKDGSSQLKNIFTPCVAFRVNGSPVKYFHNVSEVLFQPETTSSLSSTADGMSTKEYIVIGVCSLLLGLIYVASVFLYLHVKKRKSQSQQEISRGSIDDLANEINYPKNDQVTFGAPFTRAESVYSLASLTDHRNSQRSHRNSGNSVKLNEEMTGIIKNNPLLKHYPNLSDHAGFASDISNSASECEDGNQMSKHDKIKNLQASVIVHPSQNCSSDSDRNYSIESPPSPTQENECHPQSNVSIVEDMLNEEKLENMRAIANGTVRKKLYFNPAYFEPHLLASPPPAAIEFLSKIREVIAIAKYKMGSKRYQPTLIMIPEEGTYKSSEGNGLHQKMLEQSSASIFDANPTDCKRCSPNQLGGIPKNTSSKKCNNCGDKRNSIEKWLETVTVHDNKSNKSIDGEMIVTNNDKCNNFEKKSPSPSSSNGKKPQSVNNKSDNNSTTVMSTKSLRKNDISPPKTKPPPIPTTAPKIISHSLKPHINSISVETKQNSSVPKSPHGNISPNIPPGNGLSVTRHFDGENIYTFAETGNEIYNNPKFSELDSPQLSLRSKQSSTQKLKIPSSAIMTNKKFEIFDQYANTTNIQNDQQRYELMRNIKKMPDMVYDALTRDYSMRTFPSDKTNVNSFNIPTPDYDSTIEKNIKDIYNNTQSSVPSVPTPDYSTLSKKSLRHYQPDSPVYRRRSPQYLIVDYETDSLERSTTKRKCSSSSSPSSNNSSDISSQPSPSLSTALPLEEEVEVRHTIYDRIDGFRKDGDSNIKKRVAKAEFDAANNAKKEIAARIKYDTPFRGSMTIEVEHEVGSDLELSTDSDQFEPDTLDRKPKKHSFCDVTNNNAWSEHLKKSKNFVNSVDGHVSYSSLENMTSLPDFSTAETDTGSSQLILRSTNSFRTNVNDDSNCVENDKNKPPKGTNLESRPSFGSLREIYQSKIQRLNHTRPKLSSLDFADDQGRLLTLEAKHTRRQRAIFKEDNVDKNAMPPDVIPPGNINKNKNKSKDNDNNDNNGNNGNGNYYDLELCKESINKIEENSSSNESGSNDTKNCRGWSNDNFSDNHMDNNNFRDDVTNGETTSNHSASTEITGVSDTQGNSVSSEFEETSWERHLSPNLINENFCLNQTNERSGMTSRLGNLRNDYSFNKYLNRKKNSDCDGTSPNNIGSDDENPDKIEILSTRSISSRSDSKANSVIYGGALSETNSISKLTGDKNMAKIQTVYRVEVSSPTNGMQIAMGLRDRGKKTKDLKNAWKKFVSLATSRFSPNGGLTKDSESYDKKSTLMDSIERDEGIASLIDDNALISHIDSYSPAPDNSIKTNGFSSLTSGNPMRSNLFYYDPQRFGNQRQELDSGYMSADSSEVYNRRCYDRYNFKMMTEKDHIIKVDTIEDNSDCRSTRSSHHSKKSKSAINNNECVELDDKNNNLSNNIGNIYSSEDERYKSPSCATSESEDDEANMDDMCESGAESIETHSVLYKNIRKNDSSASRSDDNQNK